MTNENTERLNDLENERQVLKARLAYIETVLLSSGRIKRPSVITKRQRKQGIRLALT
ncbi:MAG: hypothetical protein GY938_32010 [Ketobacter sp.]|nr:hypothetical protein [Ketobacter sp.]